MISASNSELKAVNNPNVFANGQSLVALRVRLRDQNNDPITAPREVQLIADSTDVVFTQPPATNENGEAYGYVASQTPGSVVIHATVSPVGDEGVTLLNDGVTVFFYTPETGTVSTPPATERRIHLTWSVSRYLVNNMDGVRVRIEAGEANLMPTAVFAYQLQPMKPEQFEPVAAFDHVCSAVDLEEYPETTPLENVRPEWFRLDYVDVLLRTRDEAKDFIDSVVADVRMLKDALDITETLDLTGSLWIGEQPE